MNFPSWGLELLLELFKAGAGAVFGAIVGAMIKGKLDQKQIDALSADVAKKIDELGTANRVLALKEAALSAKQDELTVLRQKIDTREGKISSAEQQLDDLLTSLDSPESSIWARGEVVPPYVNYNDRIARAPAKGHKPRPLVMVLVNYKGGVGKTTTTGNLAAFFERKLGKRVLLIDLDYQGSLTTMLRTATGLSERETKVGMLLGREASVHTLWSATDALSPMLPKSSLVQSFYEFAKLEDQLMVQWLLKRTGDDVRYRLAKVLLDDALGDKFDIVLIDAPPRLTTGTINALCASTHVLVPTILNPISTEPVLNFLRQTSGLMNQLNPKLSYVGVVETMAPPKGHGQKARNTARTSLEEGLKKGFPHINLLRTEIARKPILADGGLGYLTDGTVADIFDALGTEIVQKVGALP